MERKSRNNKTAKTEKFDTVKRKQRFKEREKNKNRTRYSYSIGSNSYDFSVCNFT